LVNSQVSNSAPAAAHHGARRFGVGVAAPGGGGPHFWVFVVATPIAL
jgi:hypothetical protein